jgi:hypothetical protein
MFMSGEYTGLAEQFIYQGGLAMVDVSYDCDIANGAGHGEEKAWKKGQKCTTVRGSWFVVSVTVIGNSWMICNTVK